MGGPKKWGETQGMGDTYFQILEKKPPHRKWMSELGPAVVGERVAVLGFDPFSNGHICSVVKLIASQSDVCCLVWTEWLQDHGSNIEKVPVVGNSRISRMLPDLWLSSSFFLG